MSALLSNRNMWVGFLLLGTSVSASPVWQLWTPESSLAISPVFCSQTPPSVSRLIPQAEVHFSSASLAWDIPLSLDGALYGGLPFGANLEELPLSRYHLYCDGQDAGEIPSGTGVLALDGTVAVKSAACWHFETPIDSAIRIRLQSQLNTLALSEGSYTLYCRPPL